MNFHLIIDGYEDYTKWHTVQALESGTVILEMKNGPYEPLDPADVLTL